MSRNVVAAIALVSLFVCLITAPGLNTLGWRWDKSDISPYGGSNRHSRAVRLVLPKLLTAPRNRENASIVVIVTTAAHSLKRREKLRRQFAESLRLTEQKVGLRERETAIIRFAIGKANEKEMLQADRDWQSVRNESSFYGDILFLDCPDYDGFYNLWPNSSATTTKVLLSIGWAVQNYQFEYLVRLGDDAYFRVDQFLLLMKQGALPLSRAVLGYAVSGAVDDEGLSYDYPSGMGYAVTYDFCAWISASKDMLIDSWPEDMMMGRWILASKAKLFHMPARFMDYDWGGCSNDSLIIHKLPEDAWNAIDTAGLLKCRK